MMYAHSTHQDLGRPRLIKIFICLCLSVTSTFILAADAFQPLFQTKAVMLSSGSAFLESRMLVARELNVKAQYARQLVYYLEVRTVMTTKSLLCLPSAHHVDYRRRCGRHLEGLGIVASIQACSTRSNIALACFRGSVVFRRCFKI